MFCQRLHLQIFGGVGHNLGRAAGFYHGLEEVPVLLNEVDLGSDIQHSQRRRLTKQKMRVGFPFDGACFVLIKNRTPRDLSAGAGPGAARTVLENSGLPWQRPERSEMLLAKRHMHGEIRWGEVSAKNVPPQESSCPCGIPGNQRCGRQNQRLDVWQSGISFGKQCKSYKFITVAILYLCHGIHHSSPVHLWTLTRSMLYLML